MPPTRHSPTSMLIETIELTGECTHQCSFCYTRTRPQRPVAPGGVYRRLKAASERGVRTVRFTGGEPTLHPQLPSVLGAAKALGFEGLELESHGGRLGRVALERLYAAGLTRLWLILHSADDDENDRVTGVAGDAGRTWSAGRSAGELGMAVGLNVPVLAARAGGLAAILDRAHREFPTVDGVRFHFAEAEPTDEHWRAIEDGLVAACRRARRHKLDFRFEAASAPPPCSFSPRLSKVAMPLFAGLIASAPGAASGRVALSECGACELQRRCQGVPLAPGQRGERRERGGLWGAHAPLPAGVATSFRGQLTGDRRGQRSHLSIVNLAEARTPETREKAALRVNWACNERCRFCWVDFDLVPPAVATLIDELTELRRAGYRRVSLTGGEPTLVKELPRLIARATELGFEWVELQTNAVALARGPLAAELVSSGLTEALVSLHADNEVTNAAITATKGNWERSVAGMTQLLELGAQVRVSHVITKENAARTEAFVDFIADRFGGRVGICWAVAHPITEATDRHPDAIVPLDISGPSLYRGLERCLEREVPFSNQNESCGVPRCVLHDDPRFVVDLSPEAAHHSAFVKLDECLSCDRQAVCRGVRREYVARFGSRGIRALRVPTPIDNLSS